MTPQCPLCEADGGELVWRDADLRVILAPEPDYPGFVRVVWNAHEREMTDLSPAGRERLMAAVWIAERVVRDVLAPDKVNVATLGNVVPHLHWHVIARFADDRHFPAPVWAAPAPGREAVAARRRDVLAGALPALREALRAAFVADARARA